MDNGDLREENSDENGEADDEISVLYPSNSNLLRLILTKDLSFLQVIGSFGETPFVALKSLNICIFTI